MTSVKQEVLSAPRVSQAPFSPSEYRDRQDRIRAAMQADGLSLLYLSSPESMCYVSGHQAQWYQGQAPIDWHPGSGIAIHADSDRCLHFEDEDEAVLAQITSSSAELKIRGHEGNAASWSDFVVSELMAAGWLRGVIGLEMWSSRPNRGYSERFQGALESAGMQVVDATRLARGVRRLKSPQEMSYIREAQRIADAGLQAVLDHMTPGMTEIEVSAEISFAMAKEGGETPGVPVLVASGERSACPHALPSRKVIEGGDIVNLDICGVYNRYHASLARCVSMGEPRPAVAERIRRTVDGFDLVSAALRPHLPIRELVSVAESYYREERLWPDRWWVGGYELGIAFPPDTVGEFSYEVGIDPGEAIFESGMVCNYEANFYLPEGTGVSVQTSTMAFTDSMAEFICGKPPALTIIE